MNHKNKRVLIFGATGKTGLLLIKRCLEEGYTVSVFARTPKKLNNFGDSIKLFIGDVRNFQAVDKAVKDQDVILIALGVMPWQVDAILSQGATNIVKAMQRNKIKRIICLTGAALTENQQQLPLLWRIVRRMPLMRGMYDDKQKQEEIIKASALEWTLVRPVNLVNGPGTKKYQVGETLKLKTNSTISRVDVAEFMVLQIESNRWLYKGPVLSGI